MNQELEDYVEGKYTFYQKSIIYYVTENGVRITNLIPYWFIDKKPEDFNIDPPQIPFKVVNQIKYLYKYSTSLKNGKQRGMCALLATALLLEYIFVDDVDESGLLFSPLIRFWNIYREPPPDYFTLKTEIGRNLARINEIEIVRILGAAKVDMEDD